MHAIAIPGTFRQQQLSMPMQTSSNSAMAGADVHKAKNLFAMLNQKCSTNNVHKVKSSDVSLSRCPTPINGYAGSLERLRIITAKMSHQSANFLWPHKLFAWLVSKQHVIDHLLLQYMPVVFSFVLLLVALGVVQYYASMHRQNKQHHG